MASSLRAHWSAAGFGAAGTASGVPMRSPAHLVAGVAAVRGEALLRAAEAAAPDSAGQHRNNPVHTAAAELCAAARPRGRQGQAEAEGSRCGRSCPPARCCLRRCNTPAELEVSACHCGAFRVTAETGSPMALAGISEPSFAAVQSVSDMVFAAGADAGAFPAC